MPIGKRRVPPLMTSPHHGVKTDQEALPSGNFPLKRRPFKEAPGALHNPPRLSLNALGSLKAYQFTCQTKTASSQPPLSFFDITLYFLKTGGTFQPTELIEK